MYAHNEHQPLFSHRNSFDFCTFFNYSFIFVVLFADGWLLWKRLRYGIQLPWQNFLIPIENLLRKAGFCFELFFLVLFCLFKVKQFICKVFNQFSRRATFLYLKKIKEIRKFSIFIEKNETKLFNEQFESRVNLKHLFIYLFSTFEIKQNTVRNHFISHGKNAKKKKTT